MTRTEGDVAAAGATLPLVSVIIVNFNHAALLADAVGSVMAQTYKEIECIVVDDASSDASADVITGLQRRFPGLKSILRSVNGGALRASLVAGALSLIGVPMPARGFAGFTGRSRRVHLNATAENKDGLLTPETVDFVREHYAGDFALLTSLGAGPRLTAIPAKSTGLGWRWPFSPVRR